MKNERQHTQKKKKEDNSLSFYCVQDTTHHHQTIKHSNYSHKVSASVTEKEHRAVNHTLSDVDSLAQWYECISTVMSTLFRIKCGDNAAEF